MIKTLAEASSLGGCSVSLLQSWRAPLNPVDGSPSFVGGHIRLFPRLGFFFVNTLSLFGLVLAIGLVVVTPIVVVEAVERHIHDGFRQGKERLSRGQNEDTGPVIGVALVLAAVFVPTAFVPGITAVFISNRRYYRGGFSIM